MTYLLGITLVAAYFLLSLYALVRNILLAKSIGIPVVWSPVSAENPVWLACNKTLVPYLQKLPFGLGDWTDHGTLDWTWKDRLNGAQMHTKYGKLFAHATPGKLEIFTVDAAISDQVLTKKREFPKPFEVAQILDVYGPSLGSVDDENWARHRKITAGSFADKNNRLVWRESVRQAKQMAELAARKPATRSVTKDTLTLSIHVLTSAAFGIEYDFRSSSEEVIPEGHQRSYRQCLQAVLHDVLILLIVPKFIYNLPLLPQKLADFRDASREFKQYMVESVEACKHAVASGTVKGSNLLVSLVEKNEEARSIIEAGGPTSGKGLKGLRDDELYGNLFVYSFGGHETTAHTLSYAIYLLAAFPNVQDWLVEELKAVSCDLSADAAFDEAFHQLKRCLAVMFETLRLFPTVTSIPKTTGPTSSLVVLDGKEYILPPRARVYVNIPALHVHADHWGSESLSWKPSRWIECNSNEEQMRAPVKGAFAPWGDGPRVCPGRKFAQVKFVATIAAIFSEYRVEVVPQDGESFEEAREKAWQVVQDSYAALTLTMSNPEAVSLRLVKR